MLTTAPHYTPPTASEQQDLLALYQQFGCRNNDKVSKESLDLAAPQQVANASPKQQEPMEMVGLMFNAIEWSRNNVQPRTGIAGTGQNKSFRF